jgi:hypothetical protein
VVKRTYIALIFIANLFLVVYSVIPHHHHYGTSCFVLSEMQSDNAMNDCCCNHEDRQTCPFEQNINAVYKQAKEKCSDASCVLHHPDLLLQAVVFSIFNYDFSSVRETATFLNPPYLISYYCEYVSSGRGLRAPPGLSSLA